MIHARGLFNNWLFHTKPPPPKLLFFNRREREFLYLHEIDALIAASRRTRAPIRNQALVILLFCQALQPSQICWLRWCVLNKAATTLLVFATVPSRWVSGNRELWLDLTD